MKRSTKSRKKHSIPVRWCVFGRNDPSFSIGQERKVLWRMGNSRTDPRLGRLPGSFQHRSPDVALRINPAPGAGDQDQRDMDKGVMPTTNQHVCLPGHTGMNCVLSKNSTIDVVLRGCGYASGSIYLSVVVMPLDRKKRLISSRKKKRRYHPSGGFQRRLCLAHRPAATPGPPLRQLRLRHVYGARSGTATFPL